MTLQKKRHHSKAIHKPEARMHPEKQNLKQIQALLLALVVLAFPFCAWLVYQQNQPRLEMANMLACVYGFGLYAVFFSPWLPIPGRKLVSPSQRLQESVIIWFWVTYITHLTWEFGWLVFHDAIVNGKALCGARHTRNSQTAAAATCEKCNRIMEG